MSMSVVGKRTLFATVVSLAIGLLVVLPIGMILFWVAMIPARTAGIITVLVTLMWLGFSIAIVMFARSLALVEQRAKQRLAQG